jgi:hypothetical protein
MQITPDTIKYVNYVLDIVLVLAGIWMVFLARGIGGIMGRTLVFIVIGALITGSAHLLATLTAGVFKSPDGTLNFDGGVHRIIVLIGFVFLVIGFRQLQTMKR